MFHLIFAKQTMLNFSQAVAAYAPVKSDLDICLHFIESLEVRVSKQGRNA